LTSLRPLRPNWKNSCPRVVISKTKAREKSGFSKYAQVRNSVGRADLHPYLAQLRGESKLRARVSFERGSGVGSCAHTRWRLVPPRTPVALLLREARTGARSLDSRIR